jgi:hypothetical protein
MRISLKFLLFLIPTLLFAQLETEVIGVNYSTYSKSNYADDLYTSSSQKIDVFANYAHDLGKNSKLFYHISYQNFILPTKTNYIDGFERLFPKVPNYSVTTLAVGMKNELTKKWKLTNFVTYGISSNSILKNEGYFRTFSFLTRQKSKSKLYGFGLYIDNVENVTVLPVIQYKSFNEKIGIHVFFPRHIRMWKNINKSSYVELKTLFDTNFLVFDEMENTSVKVNSITTNLTYNYIFNKKIKVTSGLGLPYRKYIYNLNKNKHVIIQGTSLNITFGVSYVVFGQ